MEGLEGEEAKGCGPGGWSGPEQSRGSGLRHRGGEGGYRAADPTVPAGVGPPGALRPRRGGAADPQAPRLARSAAGARHPAPDPAWRTPGLA